MRTLDRVLPSVALDRVPSIASWPVRPVIAIYGHLPVGRWDGEGQQGVAWDVPGVLWDQPFTPGYRDATCAWYGCEIDTGVSDEAYLFPATRAVIQLDNKDGSWSAIDADGTPSDYGPGTPISIWASSRSSLGTRTFGLGSFGDDVFGDDEAPADWWLFDGFVSRWDQRADDTIEIEAFDIFSDLAQPIGTYTPGSNGQRLGARLTSILASAGESARPHRFDTGQVTLSAQQTDQAPLEEMQVVAGSDGAILFVDADGTLVALDRTWRAGRTDQPTVPTVSWNVPTAEVCLWEPVITADDEGLADKVVLENLPLPSRIFNVTNKVLTSNVVTLTIGAHTIVVGEQFSVRILDPILDGTQTATAVTATTVSYAKTAANIASQATTGIVTAESLRPDPLRAETGSFPGFVFSQTEQQWTTQLEGDGLAQLLLTDRQKRRIKLSEFDLYLLDPNQPELWKLVDMRRLDKLRFVHDQRTTGGGDARVDVNVLVEGYVHNITPENWIVSVVTSKVITYTLPPIYDSGTDYYDTGKLYGY